MAWSRYVGRAKERPARTLDAVAAYADGAQVGGYADTAGSYGLDVVSLLSLLVADPAALAPQRPAHVLSWPWRQRPRARLVAGYTVSVLEPERPFQRFP